MHAGSAPNWDDCGQGLPQSTCNSRRWALSENAWTAQTAQACSGGEAAPQQDKAPEQPLTTYGRNSYRKPSTTRRDQRSNCHTPKRGYHEPQLQREDDQGTERAHLASWEHRQQATNASKQSIASSEEPTHAECEVAAAAGLSQARAVETYHGATAAGEAK